MSQWYLSYNGTKLGPMDLDEAIVQVRKNPHGHAWRQGFVEWLPIASIDELSGAPSGSQAPPPPNNSDRRADEIDFTIFGSEMQFVDVELDPGESAIAEAGAMMYKDVSVKMETIFGDGASGGGLMGKLLGAGKRLLTGEGLFMTMFTHQGQGKAHVAFGAPFPGNIIPVPLAGVYPVCHRNIHILMQFQ